jgi:hypothetical protein
MCDGSRMYVSARTKARETYNTQTESLHAMKNIPGYVVDKALATKKFTQGELAIIDENLYRFFVPDWSEDSWRTTWNYFTDTLALAKELPKATP